jgi:hypothetical protein
MARQDCADRAGAWACASTFRALAVDHRLRLGARDSASVRTAPLDDAVPRRRLCWTGGLPDSTSMRQPSLWDAVDSLHSYS